jgi:RHS repeat-associated protein
MMLALVCALLGILWPTRASATVRASADSRLGLDGRLAEYTCRLALAGPQLASGSPRHQLRHASDPCQRWKGMWRYDVGGVELYDARARMWSPDIGTFLSIDEYVFHDPRGTLWSWPNQNPIRFRDPSGHMPEDRYIGEAPDEVAAMQEGGKGASVVLLTLPVVAPLVETEAGIALFGALSRTAAGRAVLALLGVGGASAGQQAAKRAQGCSAPASVGVKNLGGSGQQIGVIRLGQAGVNIAVGGRGPSNFDHGQFGKAAFGALAEGEHDLGVNFIGDKIAVTTSATGHAPTMADLPAISQALQAAGYNLANALVQIGNQYVRLQE